MATHPRGRRVVVLITIATESVRRGSEGEPMGRPTGSANIRNSNSIEPHPLIRPDEAESPIFRGRFKVDPTGSRANRTAHSGCSAGIPHVGMHPAIRSPARFYAYEIVDRTHYRVPDGTGSKEAISKLVSPAPPSPGSRYTDRAPDRDLFGGQLTVSFKNLCARAR